MIKYIAEINPDPRIVLGSWNEFVAFTKKIQDFQLDVETNVSECVIEQKLRTVQFGEYAPGKYDKEQWVLEWNLLPQHCKDYVLSIINDKTRKKYIQNVVFEYQIFLNYGVVMENVIDTMLNEKLIYAGHTAFLDEEGASFFSLEGIIRRRLNIDMDKTYQTAFDFEIPLTSEHIIYAAQDVQYLDEVIELQTPVLEDYYGHIPKNERSFKNHIPTLEYEAALAFGDMMYNGMRLDTHLWLKNLELVDPEIIRAHNELENVLAAHQGMTEKCIKLGFLKDYDDVLINWKSPVHKAELIKLVAPNVPGATRAVIKKWCRDVWNSQEGQIAKTVLASLQSEEDFKKWTEDFRDPFIAAILDPIHEEGDYSKLHEYLIEEHRDVLIKKGWLIPANTLTINWNSPAQVLPILQVIKPKMKSMNKEAMAKVEHPIATAIDEYKAALKLKSTYGEEFLKHVDIDGHIRTRYNQILETGRVSSANPNLQNIPSKEHLEGRYRRPFIPWKDHWKIIGSDYAAQEIVLMAAMANEGAWLDALKRGEDLHSANASLVYGNQWKIAAEPGCLFYAKKEKCNCKGHKKMRTHVKTVSFGLIYGMSVFKLSATLKITLEEAKTLMNKFFAAFPDLEKKIKTLVNFGIRYGYILTPIPYLRKRVFPEWESVKQYREAHMNGILNDATLASIGRRSSNLPIQGGSADMIKCAMVMMRRQINANNMRDYVRMICQIHDEVLTEAHPDVAEQWAKVMNECMQAAAKIIIPSGLLKAETGIHDYWTK